MTRHKVLIVMGSKSDIEVMKPARDRLEGFGIETELRIASAHRTPEVVRELAQTASDRGIGVIIAGAGFAAHLAGVIASHTMLPVIGVPIPSSSLLGIDALLSTVQMPPGIPVAAVGIGQPGAKNAAILAAQILALSDQGLSERLAAFRAEMVEEVKKADREISKT
ncbi:MAG: 5-(carboxyamino)imidazole ribonucleotide mutase [Deltaproteobacteria bacterium]|nr:5-(carboxyamino)imidazole ribonucleotide mutase [Candidatus Zymogenaceae bacterium]